MYIHIEIVLSLRCLGAWDKNKKDGVKQLQCLEEAGFPQARMSISFSEKNSIPHQFDKHKLSGYDQLHLFF